MSTEEENKLIGVDRVVHLDGDVFVIARLILDQSKQTNKFLDMLMPKVILFDEDEDTFILVDWNVHSDDEVFRVPISKVLTVSNPTEELLALYQVNFKERFEQVQNEPDEENEGEDEFVVDVPHEFTKSKTIH